VLTALRAVPTSTGDEEELQRQVTQLQTTLAHYKTIIDDTEGMLNKLQSHIETEERRWGELLNARTEEIQSLKSELASLASEVSRVLSPVSATPLPYLGPC